MGRSRLKLKKITQVDDMMIHNLVKYLVQTRLQTQSCKIFCPNLTLFEVEFGQDILQGCVSSYHLHM
jgi:hypothetical protein